MGDPADRGRRDVLAVAPELVGSLAQALSSIGRLQFLGTLGRNGGTPRGDGATNSAYRLSGVWDTFVVDPALGAALQAHEGPVCSSTTWWTAGGR